MASRNITISSFEVPSQICFKEIYSSIEILKMKDKKILLNLKAGHCHSILRWKPY